MCGCVKLSIVYAFLSCGKRKIHLEFNANFRQQLFVSGLVWCVAFGCCSSRILPCEPEVLKKGIMFPVMGVARTCSIYCSFSGVLGMALNLRSMRGQTFAGVNEDWLSV